MENAIYINLTEERQKIWGDKASIQVHSVHSAKEISQKLRKLIEATNVKISKGM